MRVRAVVVLVSLVGLSGAGCSSSGAVAVGNASDLGPPASTATEPPPYRRAGEIVAVQGGQTMLVGIAPDAPAPRVLATCTLPCRMFDSASWSADGRWVAYGVATCVLQVQRPNYGCNPESGLWVRSAGSQAQQVVGTCHVDACSSEVWQWSPVGETIADAVGTPRASQLQLIDPVTEWPMRLVEAKKPISMIDWSPDGTRIAYVAGDDLDVVTITGRVVRRLATGVGDDPSIMWSDGNPRIAYDGFVGDHSQVIVDNGDGSGKTVIDQGTKFEGPGLPAWSPTGDRVAFVTTPGRPNHYRVEVWAARSDGSQRTLLYRTPIGGPDFGTPVWSPSGAWVAVHFDAGWLATKSDGSRMTRALDDAVVEGWLQRTEQPQESAG